jgi:PAS domain S-box-containing protein
LGNEGAILSAETAQLFREWKPIRDKVIALTKAGVQAQAFSITKGKGAKHVELLNKKIEELKNYADTKALGMINEAQKTNRAIINTTAIIFIILVILSGLFGYILSRIITKEINERNKVQDKLQESEERYRVVSENFPNGAVILFDKDLKFVLAGGTVLRDVGLTSKDMEGQKVRDTLPPDRAEELIPHYESALNGEFKKFDYEYGGLDFEVYTLPVYDIEGNVTFGMSMSQNVTDRKRAEERVKASLKEKETLLLEIHHRVKNNMQVISSLLSLQADGIKDDSLKKVLIDSQNRVKAMGTVHENLYKTKNLSELSLLPFLKELAESVLNSHQLSSDEVELEINSDDISIGIDQALLLGLIVNELISNSLKYAFPAGRKGKISIKANQLNDGTLHLKFSDDGIGVDRHIIWIKSSHYMTA